jgi:SAM-dependent methyltransferase
LKREIQQVVLRGIARLPLVPRILANSGIRRVLGKTPVLRALYPSGGDRPHPFDLAHGINAGGYVGIEEMGTCVPGVAASQPFVASQPGILRAALARLPSLETCTFVDLGCGKGRPLFVAAEFPFRDIVGIELSPSLAKIARKNAGIVARNFPSRTRVKIEEGDVAAFRLPPGNLVLFLYHPFSQDGTKAVATMLDAALAAERRIVFVVYYNPVFGTCFDESRLLVRRFARMIPCAREELGFGMDFEEAVVIWQSGSAPSPPERADARIVITKPGRHAVLET